LAATVSAAAPDLNRYPDHDGTAGAAFFWLSAFYVVYCARPEDMVPGLGVVPLAKITGIAAFLAFLFGKSKGSRKFRDLPIESYYVLAMVAILLAGSLISPVWRGGALSKTLDFGKVYLVWALTFLLVTNLARLRRIVFIQAACVPVVCLLSIIKGGDRARLDGVLGGIYSNPNDLAFAVVLSLPFCLMFLLSTRSKFRKLLWLAAMLIMAKALFMTASRGGFVTLLVAGTVCLWHFAVRGKRFYLIAIVALVGAVLFATEGGTLNARIASMWSERSDLHTRQEKKAFDSFEERQFLMKRAIEGIEHYPILGIGTGNFETYSTQWLEVHMTYLQIAVEGGIPSLILYLLFFGRGFMNLRQLFKRKNLSTELKLFLGALHSSLVGFAVGALFSPEAYQFFPYFAVAYTSALLALVREDERAAAPAIQVAPASASRRLEPAGWGPAEHIIAPRRY
jgi:O-antigen ligase